MKSPFTLTDTKKSILKWTTITLGTGFIIYSMVFTVAAMGNSPWVNKMANNPFDTGTTTIPAPNSEEVTVDVSDVEDKAGIREEIEITAERFKLNEKKEQLQEEEKELNTREASLE
jgi:hypothetical protein